MFKPLEWFKYPTDNGPAWAAVTLLRSNYWITINNDKRIHVSFGPYWHEDFSSGEEAITAAEKHYQDQLRLLLDES